MGAGRAGWYSWDATSRQFTRSVHDEQLRSDPCPGPMRLRVVCDLVADARRQHECPAISKLGVQLSLKTKEDVALRAPVVRNVAGRVLNHPDANAATLHDAPVGEARGAFASDEGHGRPVSRT